MSYQVFARKYRPLTFDDVLGQDHVVQTLKNAIEHNRLAHAYLFVGPRGTGKTSTARIFAKALNCSGGPRVDFDPHEDICEEIAEGRSLDVLEIDGASNRGIDHIRDLRDNVRFAPSRGNFRIVYIDEVHMLTKESFNALLKTLEEPPPHVKFIFATTEPHKILPTILSRCQRFDLRPIPSEIIADHLLHIASAEGVALSREAAFAVAKVADGGMRDAQSMLDQLVSFCGDHIEERQVLHIFGITSRETVAQALAFLLSKELPSLLHLLHEQAEAGRDMGQFLSEIISAVREILVAKVDPKASFDSLPESSREKLAGLVKRTQTDKILRLVEVLAETEDKMRWSTNKKLHLEMGLIKAVHALAEASISDIIMALEGAPLQTSRSSAAPVPTPSPASAQASSGQEEQNSRTDISAAATANAEPPSNAVTEPAAAASVPASADPHLMDPVPDFSSSKTAAPAVQESAPEDEHPVAAKIEEEIPSPLVPDQPPPFPEEEAPFPTLMEEEPSIPEQEPAAPIEPVSDLPEEPQRIASVLSDAPASPPDSTEPTFMDPEESLPPEKRTSSFFDNLFGSERKPSRTAEPTRTEEPSPQAERPGAAVTAADWKTALEQAAAKFPLQADFLAGSVFTGHEGTVVTISFHPSDKQGMNSLSAGPLRAALEASLSSQAGIPISLSVQSDSAVPEPVQEALDPLPAPPPPPASTAATALKPRPQAPVQEAPPRQNEEESYYTDPLIDAAMEIFRARIIPQ